MDTICKDVALEQGKRFIITLFFAAHIDWMRTDTRMPRGMGNETKGQRRSVLFPYCDLDCMRMKHNITT